MSLNWNVSDINDHNTKCYVETTDEHTGETTKRLAGITECLIWATMFVGFGKITDANAKRFYQRLYQWERLVGCTRSDGEPITFQQVKDHVGLRTNVSQETDAAFRKKLQRAGEDAANRAAEAEAKRSADQ